MDESGPTNPTERLDVTSGVVIVFEYEICLRYKSNSRVILLSFHTKIVEIPLGST